MNRSNTPYSRYNTDNINLFRFSAVKLVNLFINFAYYTHTVRVQLNAKYIHVNRKNPCNSFAVLSTSKCFIY